MQGKNSNIPIKSSRKLASSLKYTSPNQLTFDGFETPFEQIYCKETNFRAKRTKKVLVRDTVKILSRQFC